MAQAHLRWEPTLEFTPRWAQAHRSNVVWNEPDNNHTWGPLIDLQDYARLYETVRAAVHSVSRGARVMTGGLEWTHSSLPRLLKAFEGKPMDAVAIHPYAATPGGTVAMARSAIALMRAYGRGSTPVVVNEYGWTSVRGTWGSTRPRNVKPYASAALVGLARLRLAEVLPFEWADASWGLNDGPFAKAVTQITHSRR